MADDNAEDLDEIQEDTTSMEEKIESVNALEKQSKYTPKTAWKPGQSGNPLGRPKKGHSITETIKAMMDEKPEIKRALGTKVLEMALKGDMYAIRMIWGYLDGMPTQDLTSGGEKLEPVKVIVVEDKQENITDKNK
jgi:hypothetical protein